MAFREFASSFLFIISWLIFAVSGYLLYWTIVMPAYAIIPFLISLIIGLLGFYCSKRIGNSKSDY